MAGHPLLDVLPEVAEALGRGQAVVALESTLITHGLPYPDNLAAAQRAEDAVRTAGAIPATIALRDGRIHVGLDARSLEAIALARRRPQGHASEPRRGAGSNRLGRDDGLGHDDRGPPRRHRRVRDRWHRRGPPRGRGLAGHQRRPRGAGSDAARRRLRRTEIDPRRRADARGPRDTRRARGRLAERRGRGVPEPHERPSGPAACRVGRRGGDARGPAAGARPQRRRSSSRCRSPRSSRCLGRRWPPRSSAPPPTRRPRGSTARRAHPGSSDGSRS